MRKKSYFPTFNKLFLGSFCLKEIRIIAIKDSEDSQTHETDEGVTIDKNDNRETVWHKRPVWSLQQTNFDIPEGKENKLLTKLLKLLNEFISSASSQSLMFETDIFCNSMFLLGFLVICRESNSAKDQLKLLLSIRGKEQHKFCYCKTPDCIDILK